MKKSDAVLAITGGILITFFMAYGIVFYPKAVISGLLFAFSLTILAGGLVHYEWREITQKNNENKKDTK